MRARPAVPALLLVLLMATPSAAAILETPCGCRRALELAPVADGFEGTAVVPFSLAEPAGVYAKLLPTASNAVHDGTRANGSTDPDHIAGQTGWWLTFRLTDADGEPATDANGDPVPDPLGVHADGQPTPTIPLEADNGYQLAITVHAPDDAFQGATELDALAVLGVKAGSGADGSGSSGASRDDAQAITLTVSPSDPRAATGGAAPEQDDQADSAVGQEGAVPGNGQASTDADDEITAGDGSHEGAGTDEEATGQQTGSVVGPGGATPLLIVAGIAIIGLLFMVTLSTGAMAVLLYLIWRELRSQRLEGGPPGSEVQVTRATQEAEEDAPSGKPPVQAHQRGKD